MNDPGATAPTDRLITVLRHDAAADAVITQLQQLDVSASRGDASEFRAELRAEMAQESADSVAGPGVPFFTREMFKYALIGTIIGSVIGGLLLAPVAIPDWGDLSFVARLLWSLVIGAFTGGTVGVLLGGILGARTGNKKLAAERGVVVTVGSTDDRVIDLIRDHDPIRIDLVHHDGTSRALVTEADEDPSLERHRLEVNVKGSDRSDEY